MSELDLEREPTPDEAASMTWWSGMDDCERSGWFTLAGSAVPADAWTRYKAWALLRPPTARDVPVALAALGGRATMAALIAELQRRHPAAQIGDIRSAIRAAIAAGLVYDDGGTIELQRAPEVEPEPEPEPDNDFSP